ncbi:MAG: CPBP family glutamic-type intramembrane protease, partial [Planctomycetales bacterium]
MSEKCSVCGRDVSSVGGGCLHCRGLVGRESPLPESSSAAPESPSAAALDSPPPSEFVSPPEVDKTSAAGDLNGDPEDWGEPDRRSPLAGAAAVLILIVPIVIGGVLASRILLALVALAGGVNPQELKAFLQNVMTSTGGITMFILPGQLMMILLALIAAGMSKVPFKHRLRLVPSRWKWSSVALLMLGTPVVGLFMICAAHGLDLKSSNGELIGTVMLRASWPGALCLIALMSLAPAFCEEVLFRGYIQSRLLQRWPPVLAIGITSAAFAAVYSVTFTVTHLDFIHAISVFPTGVWLGIVAWRTGSMWPAAGCHLAYNLFYLSLLRLELVDGAFGVSLLVLVISGAPFLASCFLLYKNPAPPTTTWHENPVARRRHLAGLLRQGDFAKVLKEAKWILDLGHDPKIRELRARALIKLGRPSAAMKEASRLLKFARPEDSEPLRLLAGECQELLGNRAAAREFYQAILWSNPH